MHYIPCLAFSPFDAETEGSEQLGCGVTAEGTLAFDAVVFHA